VGKKAAAQLLGVTLTRVNWSKGEPLQRLTKAVADWDGKTGTILEEDKEMKLKPYAKLVGIPFETLKKYCDKDTKARRALGTHVGKHPLFVAEEEQFVVDVIRRHDRGNDGFFKRQCVDTLHDLRPELNRKAVTQYFDRTLRPQHKEELTGIIKANPTTVKRTAITVAQQYRWHMVCIMPITPTCLAHAHQADAHAYAHAHAVLPVGC
jgi:hypothetical protein